MDYSIRQGDRTASKANGENGESSPDADGGSLRGYYTNIHFGPIIRHLTFFGKRDGVALHSIAPRSTTGKGVERIPIGCLLLAFMHSRLTS